MAGHHDQVNAIISTARMDKLDDNKFAHLLQPIRDLAANWDINIANELEDYLVSLFTPPWTCFQYELRSFISFHEPQYQRWRIGCAGRVGKCHLFV